MPDVVRLVVRGWPLWALLILGLAGVVVGVVDTPARPCRPAMPVTVYVPAGVGECPNEDSCQVDWTGDRWIVIPEEGGQ